MNDGNAASDNPVVCEAEDSFMCSVPLGGTASFATAVTVSISDAVAPPVLLRIPARPGKSLVLCFILVTQLAFPYFKMNGMEEWIHS